MHKYTDIVLLVNERLIPLSSDSAPADGDPHWKKNMEAQAQEVGSPVSPAYISYINICLFLKMRDPTLLRTTCYVDGDWVGASNGETFSVQSAPITIGREVKAN